MKYLKRFDESIIGKTTDMLFPSVKYLYNHISDRLKIIKENDIIAKKYLDIIVDDWNKSKNFNKINFWKGSPGKRFQYCTIDSHNPSYRIEIKVGPKGPNDLTKSRISVFKKGKLVLSKKYVTYINLKTDNTRDSEESLRDGDRTVENPNGITYKDGSPVKDGYINISQKLSLGIIEFFENEIISKYPDWVRGTRFDSKDDITNYDETTEGIEEIEEDYETFATIVDDFSEDTGLDTKIGFLDVISSKLGKRVLPVSNHFISNITDPSRKKYVGIVIKCPPERISEVESLVNNKKGFINRIEKMTKYRMIPIRSESFYKNKSGNDEHSYTYVTFHYHK